MPARSRVLCLLLVCAGCQGLPFAAPAADPAAARRRWEEGQAAMQRKEPDRAIACYQESLAADPGMVQNHLSLAAAYLEKGDAAAAGSHLARYVEVRPEHLSIRAHYAEVLFRLHRHPEARAQFDRYIEDAQEKGDPAAHLIHCHTRLMTIAQAEEDDYGEHLHRGIGLLLLARQRAALGDEDGELPAEALLCKAAGELMLARLSNPGEARPCWYLYETWTHLAQRRPAMRWLREADAAAPFSYLTPAEQRGLQLASRALDTDSAHR